MIEFSITRALQIQKRVIIALLYREVMTRYGRRNLGFLWLFLETALFVFAVSIVWNTIKELHGFRLPMTAFAVTGYSSLLLWRNMVNRCSGAMSPNIGLLFHRNVRVLDVFVSRIILEFVGVTISFLFLTTMFIALGQMELPADLLLLIKGWLLLAWFGAALALVVGCLAEKYEFIDRLWSPLSYLLMPFSGIGFMVDWLAPDAQRLVLKLPMIHGVEIIREGYFGRGVTFHHDSRFLIVTCLVLSLTGLLLARGLAKEINFS